MNSRTAKQMTGLAVLALSALILTAGPVLAGEKVERHGEASATGEVRIENMVGSLEVIGWGKKEVKLEGTLGKDVEDLEFQTGRNGTTIEVIYPRKARNIQDGAELVIHVPEGSSVRIEGVSAWIKVSGVDGEIEASSVSGDVTVTGGKTSVQAESISGKVVVDSPAASISVESISGAVTVSGGQAEVDAATVSGSLTLNFEKYLELSVESVSGDVDCTGALHPKGDFSFDTVSGQVTLTVPSNVSAEFSVTTFSGGIDNDFGQKARKTSQYTPGKELEFSVGKGEADVEINSFSGDVRIHKD